MAPEGEPQKPESLPPKIPAGTLLEAPLEKTAPTLAGSSLGDILNEANKRQNDPELAKRNQVRLLKKADKPQNPEGQFDELQDNLATTATKIEASDTNGVKIELNLDKIPKDQKGQKLFELSTLFTPEVKAFTVDFVSRDEAGNEQSIRREVQRGLLNGQPAYYYLNPKGEKVRLETPDRGTATINIKPHELQNKTRAEVIQMIKIEALKTSGSKLKQHKAKITTVELLSEPPEAPYATPDNSPIGISIAEIPPAISPTPEVAEEKLVFKPTQIISLSGNNLKTQEIAKQLIRQNPQAKLSEYKEIDSTNQSEIAEQLKLKYDQDFEKAGLETGELQTLIVANSFEDAIRARDTLEKYHSAKGAKFKLIVEVFPKTPALPPPKPTPKPPRKRPTQKTKTMLAEKPRGKRIPEGYEKIPGALPKGIPQKAGEILSYNLQNRVPIGTYTPFTLNGKEYIALHEYHSEKYTPDGNIPGRFKAITVFRKKA